MRENRIIIDSSKRSSYNRDGVLSTSSKFEIELKYAKNHIKKVLLRRAVIPNTIYNINANNNTFSFTISATTYTGTITPGVYTATSLADAIQTAFNALFAGFTVAYSTSTLKITISHASAFTINSRTANCYTELGFGTIGVSATSQTGSKVVSLARPYYFFVNVAELSSHYMTVEEKKATWVIPKNVNSNGVVDYEPENPIEIDCNNLTLKTLNIHLTDAEGVDIDLNGSEWMLIIEVVVDNK